MIRKAKPAKAPARTPVDAKTAEKLEMARACLQPSILAANAIGSLNMVGDHTDVPSLTVALNEQCHRVLDGKLHRAESMLISQALTLDALFNRELMTAMKQEHLPQFEAHMRCALRAQSQCRSTLETLAVIKNPPVLIAKQANIAHGPQQVNNGPPLADAPSRAREIESAQNRLLEQRHGERLDTLPAQAANGADPAMAAVGEVHGAEVCRR